jgi:hypothetical protein
LFSFSSISFPSIGFKNLCAIGVLKKLIISFMKTGIFLIVKITFFILEIKKIFLTYLAIRSLIVLFFFKDFLFSKNFIKKPVEIEK